MAARPFASLRVTAVPKTTQYSVTVQFGDCDPAGIVFYPNFQRWMDEASL